MRILKCPQYHSPLQATSHAHDDGSLTLELPLLSEIWAFGWVLSFGPAAELLEPSDLRERFAQRLRRLIDAL